MTAVCPGVVDTPMLDTAGPDDLPATALSEHVRELFRQVQPRWYAADQLAQDIIRASTATPRWSSHEHRPGWRGACGGMRRLRSTG